MMEASGGKVGPEKEAHQMGEEASLWGGRFTEALDRVMAKFNSSLHCDKRMYREDLLGSIAYTRVLEGAGVVTEEEGESLRGGLQKVLAEWEKGDFREKPGEEDVHTANERRLKELVGEAVGGKLHTGRSRNDQVATDTRLWLMSHLRQLAQLVLDLIEVMVGRSKEWTAVLVAGYTHLQRAQPIRLGHWVLSYAWWLHEDLRRLHQVYTSADQCPLGSGALAGTPLAVDREALAKDLGFSRITYNSMMAVADRDFVADYLYTTCLLCTHLSRLAEDLSVYSSSEFSLVRLSDEFSTGSSIMPQKKNPDSAELIRGKAATMIGRLTGFMCVLKGLPSTYNKDLQEDKPALFEAADTVTDLILVTTGVVRTLQVNVDGCRATLSDDMLATDMAYYLVKKGMSFRTAHGAVGAAVKAAETLQCSLSQVPLEALTTISPLFDSDISQVWSYESSVEQYSALGGTSAGAVRRQQELLEAFLHSYTVDGKAKPS